MIKYTDKTLKQLQTILKEGGYQVRKGRGAFNTGYCILQAKRVVVLNHYHSAEAKINALIEILNKVDLKIDDLSKTSKNLYDKIFEEGKGEVDAENETTIVNIDDVLSYSTKFKEAGDKRRAAAKAAKQAEEEALQARIEAQFDAHTKATEDATEEDAIRANESEKNIHNAPPPQS